ncbi:MAG: hypothetical protein N4A35_15965 [Flavobacteriales bacterium]|jgi:hypothetical protein|nr:hypothetical protein [Flavobacteriales bacterium]
MKITALITLLTIAHAYCSQNLNAYLDDRGYFYGYFNQSKIRLEHQPINSFKVGYNAIAYEDTRGSLFYFTKDQQKIEVGTFPIYYIPTDYLFGFQGTTSLGVIDGTEKKILTHNVGKYIITDSLIVYNDNIKKGFYVYYNGASAQLENNIIESEVTNFKAKENTVAYFNAQGYFKVFNANATLEIDRPSSPYHYSVGRDIVAFTDYDNETFNIVENGEVFQLEETIPQSFYCGDGLVAYITNQDVFRIYKDGQVQEICAYAPSYYFTIDDLIIYENLGRFTVYVDGQSYELENYRVDNFQADGQAIAYIDNQGWLIYFFDGKKEKITNQKINNFSLIGNTLQYSLGINQFMLFENKRNIQ